jgi:anti-sigma-K factor RskA
MRRSPEEEETMFGKHLRLKRFLGGIVVTAVVAVVAVPSALSSTSSRGGTASAPDVLARYVANHTGEAAQQVQGYRFVTDTLGGTRQPVAAQQVQPNRFTSDTIADVHGYNANAYVSGGSTPAVAKATQDLGYGRTTAPVQAGGSGGSSSSWRDIGIASGAALLLVLMLGALRASRKDEPTARTA